MSKIFCCYSINLRDYLLENGVLYDVVGLNPNSKKMFWAFYKDDKLDILLKSWSNK